MIKNLRPEELQVGMYVMLPMGWTAHPFLRGRFVIDSKQEIFKIQSLGLKKVSINTAKGRYREPEPITTTAEPETDNGVQEQAKADPGHPESPPAWTPQTLVPPELMAAIDSKELTPENKSHAVYLQSMVMMERLLESPSAENIIASKKAVSAVTELILSDDQTSHNLLRITSHDFYTYTHSVNVGIYSIALSKALLRHSDAHNLHELGAGFFLHDLGKVNVNPAIINKQGRLTDEEMGQMRTHPYQGYKLLEMANALTEECRYIVMQHHERANGEGYPRRLKGDEIHRYGRICCIADVFDALTAERSYKKALSRFEALKLMKEKMSFHFDKELFSTFVMLFN